MCVTAQRVRRYSGHGWGSKAYVSAGPMRGGAATSLHMGARPGTRDIARAISGGGDVLGAIRRGKGEP